MEGKKNGPVLIIDDDPDVLQAARLYLKQYLARIDTAMNPESLPDRLAEVPYDVVVLDMNFSEGVSSGREGFNPNYSQY